MTSKQPFFLQFVEGQELTKDEIKQVAGGGLGSVFEGMKKDSIDFSSFTKKYPSDDDEGSSSNGIMTLKYPSDDDGASIWPFFLRQ